ncbi:MAG: redoxin family protein [Mogibacterium sp.]|nr:redoxin family protein [Mogibacterium sp.]
MGKHKRKLIQLYSAVLYNACAKGFIKGEIYTGRTKIMCVPGLNCYSCPAAVGACPLGSLQNALASSENRAGFYVFGIIMLWGLMLGRTICGWLCPFGLIQELLHKIPVHKIKKNGATRALTYLKYVILTVFAAAVPLWFGLREGRAVPGFCKYICPAGTLEGAIGLLSNPSNESFFGMLGAFFTAKFVILMIIGLACVFCYRSFCRFLCPLGAIYGMFNRIALTGVKVDADRCTHCGACAMKCRMDIRHVGDRECISCAECVDVCSQGAISLRAGRITLIAPEKDREDGGADHAAKRERGRRIAGGVALAVLVFALLWYNVLDRSGETGPDRPAGAYGHEAGDELEDFTIECLDGSTFSLADTRGRVVFINLWATYCGPCVEELPYFNDLAGEHPDDVTVLAVHNPMSKDDIPAYLADKGWDDLRFALDTKDKLVWNTVGGGAAMPQTIVLDRNGKVIYNQAGRVTPELLAGLYEQAVGL